MVSETAEKTRFDADSTALQVIEGIDLTGKTAIVTGGASGLGVETARALASAGAAVVLAVRDIAAGERVAAEINAQAAPGRVTVSKLELDDLASVRAFAARWDQRPLNLLINNAGVMACPQGTTRDGFETQLGVNHLGHFLLTLLLMPALKRGAPARVVSLSSSAHNHGDIDFDDPHFRHRPYKPFQAYGQSKAANILFAAELDRRYAADGVRGYSVMPGVIPTPLLRHMTPQIYAELGIKPPPPGSAPTTKTKTPEQGAATTVLAATSPELAERGGICLDDCAPAVLRDPDAPGPLRGLGPHATDPEKARRLWDLSLREVGLAD